jgi:carbonic anhydrase
MSDITPVSSSDDIFPEYRANPIGLLLEYHNLGRPFEMYSKAKLLIGTCMDNRINLHIPEAFAFIIRAGGADLRNSEFKISYAIAIARISHIAMIGHTDCGMVNLDLRKNQFVAGLTEVAGWEKAKAEKHFLEQAHLFEIGNSEKFIVTETKRLRLLYPSLQVAPMVYSVEDHRLHLIRE